MSDCLSDMHGLKPCGNDPCTCVDEPHTVWSCDCEDQCAYCLEHGHLACIEKSDMIDETYHDEDTLLKVYEVLDQWITPKLAQNIINDLQNAGILFRERLPDD